MLRVERLEVRGLAPISFTLNQGEILAVRGASGSGKTVLLRAIADLDPGEGLVFLNGGERQEMTGPQWRQRVRYVAAEPAWWSDHVADHFTDIERVKRALPQLALSPDTLTRSVNRLSTGERQRLGLLRALEGAPVVLLFDEPTASLDDGSSALVEELIRYQSLAGACIVLVTHNDAQAKRLATKTIHLEDGQARLEGWAT